MVFDSLLEQARFENPTATDEALVVDLAAGLVELLDLELPTDPAIVASYQGISRIERRPMPWAGCLVEEHGELVIRIRSTDTPGRQRFTTFHEVAHTFLPGFRHAPQYRCAPLSPKARQDHTEMLCDLAASELLMPTRHVLRIVKESAFDLEAVGDLADECEASFEAAARRFVSLWPERCLFLRMDVTTKPRDRDGEPKLRVVSTLANGSWPFIPPYKSVSDNHTLRECLDGAAVDCVTDLDDLVKASLGPLEVHARHYPFIDSEGELHDRVLVLARPSR
jgi:hypothetical protein